MTKISFNEKQASSVNVTATVNIKLKIARNVSRKKKLGIQYLRYLILKLQAFINYSSLIAHQGKKGFIQTPGKIDGLTDEWGSRQLDVCSHSGHTFAVQI